MKLDASPRTVGKKSKNKQVRREGDIPAVLYSKGVKNKELVVKGSLFNKFLRTIEPGTISSKVFSLNIDGKEHRAVLADIQYHVVTYNVLHLDFKELHEGVPVILNIPVKCTGIASCPGIKLGGSLRQPVRVVKVRCLPKDIPSHFEIDVQEMTIGQSKKLSDIKYPAGVQPVDDLNTAAVVIARK